MTYALRQRIADLRKQIRQAEIYLAGEKQLIQAAQRAIEGTDQELRELVNDVQTLLSGLDRLSEELITTDENAIAYVTSKLAESLENRTSEFRATLRRLLSAQGLNWLE